MMKTLCHRHGFSLVETVVALGLFAFCILGVLALIPVGMGSARSVAEESTASALADAFFGAWLVAPTNANAFPVPAMFTNPPVPVNRAGAGTFYFRDDGEQSASATEASLQMNYNAVTQAGGFAIDLVFQWPPGQTTNAATQTRSFQQFIAR